MITKHLLNTTLVLLFFAPLVIAQPKPVLAPYLSGFNKPIKVVHAGDSRLFVAEIGGKIKVVKNGVPIQSPAFLDISSKMRDVDWSGIFSIAFHPNYQSNGYFYVLYNVKDSHDARVSRFQRTGATDSDIADATETVILTIPYTDLQSGHRGGDLAFGKDNFLYISTGDSGPGGRGDIGDPDLNAQNDTKLFGKIIRLDVDSPSPGDNALQKIWAKGLRNPWRMSFDRSTGDFWFGDNGQDDWEEVNFLSATDLTSPRNFGWSYMEGNDIYRNRNCNCTIATSFIAPKLTYPGYNRNGGSSASVMGGYVYRGTKYPTLGGCYFFGDYNSGKIGMITPEVYAHGAKSGLFDEVTYPSIISFGEGYDGELYTVSFSNGTIAKITLLDDALPVELLYFTATTEGCHVNLKWKTGNESRFSHFELQHSKNAKDFITFSTIPSAETPEVYHFIDNTPFEKNTYYRLKMVDKDGSFAYSKLVSTKTPCSVNPYTVFPNPTTDSFKISGLNAGDLIRVYNAAGALVLQETTISNAELELNVKGHPRGVYTITVEGPTGGVIRQLKLVKL